MQNIDTLPDSVSSDARAISADGSTIVGSALLSGSNFFSATIWDEPHGMRILSDVLTSQYGLDLRGVDLWSATAVSADVLVISGRGLKNFDGNNQTVAWRVDLNAIPEPGSLVLMLIALPALAALFWLRPHRALLRATPSPVHASIACVSSTRTPSAGR